MQILWFCLGILLFIGLILGHEWGHFFFARKNKIDVEEFGLGFPPRAWGKKLKSGMMVSINWLPLGGFVKLKGEYDDDNRKGSFGAASLSAKVQVLLAGVGVNVLIGFVLLTFVAAVGFPNIDDQFNLPKSAKETSNQLIVREVEQDSPAQKAGLKFGDSIVKVSDVSIASRDELKSTTKQLAGQHVQLDIKRQGKPMTLAATINTSDFVDASIKADKPVGYLGIGIGELKTYKAGWSSPIVAASFIKNLTVMSLKAIGHAFGGLGSAIAGLVTNNHQARVNGQTQASSQVGGPIAMGNALWYGGNFGYNYLLWIIGFISVSLAILNVLPIPALDGGRLVLTLIFHKILRKKLTNKLEDRIHGTGMAVLLILFVLITIVDVKRF